ncbi:MAG: hypothetical protein Q7V19_13595, partial [Bacteroidales bacterium]|nr:hypothetical protein [Bacteroidales bacterium]
MNKVCKNNWNAFKIKKALLFAFLSLSIIANAQLFVELPGTGQGLANANAVWLSSGGKLHPLANGETKAGTNATRTLLFRQTAKNTFVSGKTS